MSQKDLKRLSFGLVKLLRHNVHKTELKMDTQGYVRLTDILDLKQFKDFTIDNVKHVVQINDKQRLGLKEVDHILYIRANQGHSNKVAQSLKDDLMLTLITKPMETCIHGTYQEFLPAIQKTGLSRMTRKHIHMTTGLIGEVQSGFRGDCDVLLYIDTEKAMHDGHKFYLSDNGVVLTEGPLDYKYVKEAVPRSKDLI